MGGLTNSEQRSVMWFYLKGIILIGTLRVNSMMVNLEAKSAYHFRKTNQLGHPGITEH